VNLNNLKYLASFFLLIISSRVEGACQRVRGGILNLCFVTSSLCFVLVLLEVFGGRGQTDDTGAGSTPRSQTVALGLVDPSEGRGAREESCCLAFFF